MKLSTAWTAALCATVAWSSARAQRSTATPRTLPPQAGSEARTRVLTTRADTAARQTLPAAVQAALAAGKLHRVDSTTATSVPADTQKVVVKAGQFLAFREVGKPLRVQRRFPLGAVASSQIVDATSIPLTYSGRASDRTEVSLHPWMIQEKALRYVPKQRVFQGSFLLFLEDRNAPNARRDLGCARPATR